MDEDLKKRLDDLAKKVDSVESEAEDKGHFFVLIFLMLLLQFTCENHMELLEIKDKLGIPLTKQQQTVLEFSKPMMPVQEQNKK